MESLIGWAGLLFGFSGLIFIHELGHFLLAKWNGVRVRVFSIGMGPYLLSFTHNGTVYALSLIPMGGYVQMLGQDDLNADLAVNKDPGDFRNKRPGQKASILAAGAAFNILLTLFIFTCVYWIGYDINTPSLGNIPADKALAKATIYDSDKSKPAKPADIKKGDRIVRVNDTPVKSYFDLMMQITACPIGEPIVLAVQRKDRVAPLDYVLVNIEDDKKQGVPNIGLGADTIFKEEEPLALGFATEMFIVITDDPSDLADSPAGKTKAFKKGDRVLRLEDRTDPAHAVVIPMDSPHALTNAAAASNGKPRVFVVERDVLDEKGVKIVATKEIPVTPEKNEKEGGYKFGLKHDVLKRVMNIDENSDAYKAGLRKDYFVRGFDPDRSNDHPNYLPSLRKPWKSGKLIWVKNYDDKKAEITPMTVPPLDLAAGERIFRQKYVVEEEFKAGGKTGGFVDALSQSWDDTRRYTVCMFSTLKNLVTGHVNAKNLSGPVGIGGSIFDVASKRSPLEYFWWLGFISLNLGVMQLLPIPLLDGFHLVMVLAEKVRGSMVPAQIQEKFMYVGLAMIGSLLVFVMWNDIYRLIVR